MKTLLRIVRRMSRSGAVGFLLMVTGIALTSCSRQHEQVLSPVSLRPLESTFEKVSEVTLPGVRPNEIVGLVRDSEGTTYVVDPSAHSVEKFDSHGRDIGPLGKYGWAPGDFVAPWAIACDSQNNVYVSDIKTGRLSVFNDQGQLIGTRILSALDVIVLSLNISPSGEIYIGGPTRSDTETPFLLHGVDATGAIANNFYPRDPLVTRLRLTVVGGVNFDIDPRSGNLYAAQPISTHIHVYSSSGSQLKQFDATPASYEKPFKFPQNLADTSKLTNLLAQWTQLTDLRLVPGTNRLLLSFNIHKPVPYDFELYSTDGQLIAGQIGSRLRFAYMDPDAHAYFFDPSSNTMTISEFALPGEKGNS